MEGDRSDAPALGSSGVGDHDFQESRTGNLDHRGWHLDGNYLIYRRKSLITYLFHCLPISRTDLRSPLSVLRRRASVTGVPASDNPVSFRQRSISNPDDLRHAVSNTTLRIDRLSATGTPSRLQQFQGTDGWGLDIADLHFKLQIEGPMAPGCVALVVVHKSNGTSICGVPLEDEMLLTIPVGSTLEGAVMPGFSYAGFTLPAAAWAAAQLAATGMATDPHAGSVAARRLPHASFGRIRASLDRTVAGLRAAAANGEISPGASHLVSDYLAILAGTCSDPAWPSFRTSPSAINHMREVRRAQAWIHAHIDEDIRVARVCEALSLSRRQLEYAFRRTLDTSPQEFVRALRLNRIRQRLKTDNREGLSVTRIAFDHGMTHLGRFAASYRELFGELPSQTRKSGKSTA